MSADQELPVTGTGIVFGAVAAGVAAIGAGAVALWRNIAKRGAADTE